MHGCAGIIDEEKRVKHTKFGSKIEDAVRDPSKCKVKLKAENVDISYPPIVQSGGVYDLRPSAVNDDRPMQYDVVLMGIGEAFPHAVTIYTFILSLLLSTTCTEQHVRAWHAGIPRHAGIP